MAPVSERARQALPVLIGLALFVAALEVLRLELRTVSWHEVIGDVLRTPALQLAAAVVLTILNYATLTGYDLLAFAYIRKPLPRRQIALVSFLAYAIANNVGFAMLSGGSVRYRFYTRWGVTAEELSRIVFSYSVTFWLGLCALGGLSLLISPVPDFPGAPRALALQVAGAVLILVVPAYIFATLVRRQPLRLGGFELPLPAVSIALAQVVISAADWALAGAVLYVLLPPPSVPFFTFLSLFLIAILLGMVSHVPGGVGVFEGLMVLLLKPYLASAQLLPALVVFRAVYYLLPLAVALAGLAVDEVWQRRAHVARAGAMLGSVTERLAPPLLAVFTFLSGVILLL